MLVLGQREFSGVMAKPWRIVALSIGALATMFLVLAEKKFWFGGRVVLDWAHIAILAGCVQTVIVRYRRLFDQESVLWETARVCAAS